MTRLVVHSNFEEEAKAAIRFMHAMEGAVGDPNSEVGIIEWEERIQLVPVTQKGLTRLKLALDHLNVQFYQTDEDPAILG